MGILFNQKRMNARRAQLRHRMTKAEKVFWSAVRGKQIFGIKFRRQQSIDGFIVDFYVADHRLVIELDGGYHLDPEVASYDAWRQEIIERYGMKFLRFTNSDIFERLDWVIERVKEALAQREHLPSTEGRKGGVVAACLPLDAAVNFSPYAQRLRTALGTSSRGDEREMDHCVEDAAGNQR